jgi:hypothetical protein
VSGLRRFGWSAVLVGLAVLLVLFTLLAAWNPWRYTYLMPVGRPLIVVIALGGAAALVAAAAVRVLRGELERQVVGIGGALLALLVWVGGGFTVSYLPGFDGHRRPSSPRVVAVSADNAFELVLVEHIGWFVYYDVVRLRTREGLLSRESDRYVACFAQEDDVRPEEVFVGARFTGVREIEISMRSGRTWTTTFDADSLRPTGQLGYGCDDTDPDSF